ncbi:MAG UNVERIFIED_CONTAM: toprim domain-containing protein [Anaerolineae bacterium]
MFDKNRVLFGLDLATQSVRQSETAVIVEGYMDAITAHQYGFHNVVAQMGTAFTERQLQLIAPRWAKRIVLALDSDHAGQKATVRSLEVARAALQADLSGKLKVELRVLQLEGAKDPDDLIRAEPQKWAHLVEHALTVADFLIETEVSQLPSTPRCLTARRWHNG